MIVEFASGYTTAISNTNDYDVKEFPPLVGVDIRKSLNVFLKQQSFLQIQNSGAMTKAILILGFDSSNNICAWLPCSVEQGLEDHVGRKTFKVRGNLAFKEQPCVCKWRIIVLCDFRRDIIGQWLEEQPRFSLIDSKVRGWSEFSTVYHYEMQLLKKWKTKRIRLLVMVIICAISFIITIALLLHRDMEYKKQQRVYLKQISILQREVEQQFLKRQDTRFVIDKSVKKLLLRKLESSRGIEEWTDNHYPSVEAIFKKLAQEKTFDDGLAEFCETLENDHGLWKFFHNYEPGFVYDTNANTYKRDVKAKIIEAGKIGQYRAIAYYLGILQFYKEIKKRLNNGENKQESINE